MFFSEGETSPMEEPTTSTVVLVTPSSFTLVFFFFLFFFPVFFSLFVSSLSHNMMMCLVSHSDSFLMEVVFEFEGDSSWLTFAVAYMSCNFKRLCLVQVID